MAPAVHVNELADCPPPKKKKMAGSASGAEGSYHLRVSYSKSPALLMDSGWITKNGAMRIGCRHFDYGSASSCDLLRSFKGISSEFRYCVMICE